MSSLFGIDVLIFRSSNISLLIFSELGFDFRQGMDLDPESTESSERIGARRRGFFSPHFY